MSSPPCYSGTVDLLTPSSDSSASTNLSPPSISTRLPPAAWRMQRVRTGSWPIDLAHDVSHASLVAQEGCEVDRLGRVILGEALHFPTMPAAAFPRQEAQGPMPGSRELPVRLGENSQH